MTMQRVIERSAGGFAVVLMLSAAAWIGAPRSAVAAETPAGAPAKVAPAQASAPHASAPQEPAPHAAISAADMQTFYLVMLRKGPNWSATPTPESKAIQEAHLANIVRLWKEGKMTLAGPLGDDGDLRGIFIFQVATLEEAKSLTDSDPAIKAERLVAEIHPWWVDRRALPQAGKYCQSVDPQ